LLVLANVQNRNTVATPNDKSRVMCDYLLCFKLDGSSLHYVQYIYKFQLLLCSWR